MKLTTLLDHGGKGFMSGFQCSVSSKIILHFLFPIPISLFGKPNHLSPFTHSQRTKLLLNRVDIALRFSAQILSFFIMKLNQQGGMWFQFDFGWGFFSGFWYVLLYWWHLQWRCQFPEGFFAPLVLVIIPRLDRFIFLMVR